MDALNFTSTTMGRGVREGKTVGAHRGGLRKALPHIAELLLIVGAYFAYMYTRKLVFTDFEATAMENAHRMVEFESTLGFFWEPHWQQWALNSAQTLVIFFNWAYIVTFWPIILTTALILYLVNRRRYFYFRNVIMLSFVFALLIFMLFPLAPPRMLGDFFVDTIKEFGPAFYASREFANYYNAYAAMPSLHFSWTVIFGVLFFQFRNPWLKVLGVVYPTMTLLAITITGNHYLMDAVGGAAVMACSFGGLELGRRFLFPTLRLHWGNWQECHGPAIQRPVAAFQTWCSGARARLCEYWHNYSTPTFDQSAQYAEITTYIYYPWGGDPRGL